MKPTFGRPRCNHIKAPVKSLPAWLFAMAAIACACGSGEVHTLAGKNGAYVGTIEVTGTEISPKVSYRASVKVNLPV